MSPDCRAIVVVVTWRCRGFRQYARGVMNPENDMAFSRIKFERQKRSWTQEQLAERAHVSTRTIQRIECGAEAAPETLRLIADALGVAAESLRPQKQREDFGAPWSRFVKGCTAIFIGAVVVFSVLLFVVPLNHVARWTHWVLLATVLLSLFFSISGYSVRQGKLFIHRIGWATKYDLSTLTGCQVNPHAMMGSIRLFGNGGLFCIIGGYRNAVLGNFRAYTTDPARCVVLRFGARTIVVSPDDPEAFAAVIEEAVKTNDDATATTE